MEEGGLKLLKRNRKRIFKFTDKRYLKMQNNHCLYWDTSKIINLI